MTETPERRLVGRAKLTVCQEGHVARAEPEGEAWQIRCKACRTWTWEDGNFCGECGSKLR